MKLERIQNRADKEKLINERQNQAMSQVRKKPPIAGFGVKKGRPPPLPRVAGLSTV